jgi:methionine-gamma-lyase
MVERPPATLVVHGPKLPDEHGSLAPPVYHTSTYVFSDCDQAADMFSGRSPGFMYSRMGNPSTRNLELKVADLEGSETAAACSSAISALSSIAFSFLADSDHVLVDSHLSPEALELFTTLTKFGIQLTIANTVNLPEFIGYIQPNTKLVVIITPAPPLLVTVDIAAVSQAAKRVNAIVVVDSSFATALITRPISLGADLVLLNASGVLTGHSDVVAGLICGPERYISVIKSRGIKDMIGCVLSPEDATLGLRGMETLKLRLFQSSENARIIVNFLNGDPVIKKLFYPGISRVARQMDQFGNMIGFALRCTRSEVQHFLDALRLIQVSDQTGGVATMIWLVDKHVFKYGTLEEKEIGITLLQLSVGIEAIDDLTTDLNRGLEAIAKLKKIRRVRKTEKVEQSGRLKMLLLFIAVPVILALIVGFYFYYW